MIARIVRPGVEIQQLFLANNPTLVEPDMPTVIVGPNYQIVERSAGGDYVGEALVVAYPELEVGAIVEQDEVVARLSDVILTILDDENLLGDVGGATGDALTITPGEGDPDFTTAAVAVGDLVTFETGQIAKVEVVDSATKVTLDRDLTLADKKFVITRPGAAFDVPEAGLTIAAESVTLAADILLGGKAVRRASVLVLTANRLTTINQATNIEPRLGRISKLNPLALGITLAKGNTVSSVLAMGIAGTDAADWLTALDALQNEGVYTIVLLTQDTTIQGLVKTHVEQMSLPAKSKFRIAFVNLPHPRESVVVEPLELAQIKRAANVLSITQPNAEFSGSVLVGYFDNVTARTEAPATANAALAAYYIVTSIKNNSTLILESFKYVGGEGTYIKGDAIAADFAADTVDMTVVRVLDKDGQALAIAGTADSYGSRRIVYITNHECVVTVEAQDETLPGYYLCAAYGGMNAGNPPHQGFTNLGVTGIKSVRYGNRYFNDDQMGLIAGSGGWLCMQETEESLPFAFIQTTTDNATVQRRELSITKTLDYYSIGLKGVLSRFMGPWNNIDETLTAVRNGIDGFHRKLIGLKYPRIGSPILSGVIASLAPDEAEPDVSLLTTDIVIPTPLNRMRVTVQVLS